MIYDFFEKLWKNYSSITPQAEKIKSLFLNRHEFVVNDHVAFRTFDHPLICIGTLEKILFKMGYKKQGDYVFDEKNLVASSYSHYEKNVPKIFISQYDNLKLSAEAQKIIDRIFSQIENNVKNIHNEEDIFISGILWDKVSLLEYEFLLEQSEYLGWLSTMGLRPNHFTISTNHLIYSRDVHEVLRIVEDSGFKINEVGGRVKGSKDVCLAQGSTIADSIKYEFSCGHSTSIPTCFYEFAQRFPDHNGILFDEFIVGNADKIFDSTNSSLQKGNKKMYKITIVGAGKIGSAIAKLLAVSGNYVVTVIDKDQNALDRLSEWSHERSFGGSKSIRGLAENSNLISTGLVNTSDLLSLRSSLEGEDAVLSAGPYTINVGIASLALELGLSYFDLTEDRYTTDAIRKMAENSRDGQVFAPQCGLAPGFIGMLAGSMVKGFDVLDEVKMRVGALPRYPSNKLLYNLTWSTDGLINEYSNPAEAIVDYKKIDVPSLEGLEQLSIDGSNFEAFNTSGGLGTLCETLDGKVKNLNYKTVRYPGHQHLISFLIQDLGLGQVDRRPILKDILEKSVPTTPNDFTLAFCSVEGMKGGRFVEETRVFWIQNEMNLDENWTSIQLSTANGAAAVIDMHRAGLLSRGFVKQEEIDFESFLHNEFGHIYRDSEI